MTADAAPAGAVPRQPAVDIRTVHPALEKMARGICLAEGHAADEHWFDYDDKSKVDRGGPAWTHYLGHARQALGALLTLDDATLMRGTAAFSWDTLPPQDDLGDPDYVVDMRRFMTALHAHITAPVKT